MSHRDPDARRAYYEATKHKRSRYTRVREQRVREFIADQKARPCVDCLLSYPTPVMEFDHVRGTKLGNVSDLVKNGASMQRILSEIAKCEVVCANCHRLRTWARRSEV